MLKNYLFSVVHAQNQNEHELLALEHNWEELVGKLGSESFPDFLRTHWNSRNRFLRHSELFKKIRDQIRNREQVFDLVRKMHVDVDTYVALSKPEDEFWSAQQRKYISELRMFNVRQVYPLLLAGHRKFNEGDFCSLLKAVSIISFRYNVISNNPASEQERVYHQIAEKIERENLNFRDSLAELRTLYVSDTEFKHAFGSKILRTTQSRNKRIARYIFSMLELHLGGTEHDIDSNRFNIEHIMPESLSEAWQHISEVEHEMFVYRLGNLCLLHTGANREIGNSEYDVKRLKYQESDFRHTRRIAEENSYWNPERIEVHQQWMATQATSIWRLSQYDNQKY